MALTGSYGYTNTTPSEYPVYPIALGIDDNYAVTVDDPGKCVLKNTTSPIDQAEEIIFLAQDINYVAQEEKNMYPPKVRAGRSLTVKVENKKRMTSSTDDTFTEDDPISCNISWRFLKSRNITHEDLLAAYLRAGGAIFDENGQSILAALMLEQLNPKK